MNESEIKKMAKFVSDELGLGTKLEELGVFDSLMDEDSNFFINIIRLRDTQVIEFKDSYDTINSYFRNIGILLQNSKEQGDKLYKSALKMFKFPEVKGVNLGFSKGGQGAGFGTKLSNQIIKDASEIIKSGSSQPEIFHLVSLFEENVGPDRLSDMIARIIYTHIVNYTRRIISELKINEINYLQYQFKEGLLKNPYKGCDLLLLPVDVLHELPIAKSWDDIDRVVNENEIIKKQMSELVRNEWSKLASSQKKHYIKEYIFMKPEQLSEVIEDYLSTKMNLYDVYQNIDYRIERLVNQITKSIVELDLAKKNSYDSAIEIITEFKSWIENQKGYSIFEGVNKRNEEKIIQRTLHGMAGYYCKLNNLDISPESNTGRGPVDFKISRGEDKTIVEIKLTSNQETVHGLEIQIEEYAKSEGTENKIFLLVDNGRSSIQIKRVQEAYEKRRQLGQNPATVIMIDAKPKKSASKYNPNKEF